MALRTRRSRAKMIHGAGASLLGTEFVARWLRNKWRPKILPVSG